MRGFVRTFPSLKCGLALAALPLLAMGGSAVAQDITPPGYKLPPLGTVTAATPAKQLFGRAETPANIGLGSIGFYAKGCLSNGVELPADGPNWQVMRPSRNRAWGNAAVIKVVKNLAAKAPTVAGWPGILIGDMAQPRGGPMLTGHASHQIGLDADIWLTPMPNRRLSVAERETKSAVMMVRPDRLDVSRSWTAGQMGIVRAAAQDPAVERIFVNAAIKKAMCRDATGDRSWLGKVRPMYGHDYHFHIRITCPRGSPTCTPQKPPTGEEGCGKELDYWFSDAVLRPRPGPKPSHRPPQLTLSDLPAACSQVIAAP